MLRALVLCRLVLVSLSLLLPMPGFALIDNGQHVGLEFANVGTCRLASYYDEEQNSQGLERNAYIVIGINGNIWDTSAWAGGARYRDFSRIAGTELTENWLVDNCGVSRVENFSSITTFDGDANTDEDWYGLDSIQVSFEFDYQGASYRLSALVAEGTTNTGVATASAQLFNTFPTIDYFDGDSPTLTESRSPILLDVGSNATVSDAELDALNGGHGDYSGANLTFVRSGSSSVDDAFSLVVDGASFTVSGSDLQVGGQTFATFTNANGQLAISFTSSGTPATTALVQDVLRHVAYSNSSSTPPVSTAIDAELSDGLRSATATADVAIVPIPEFTFVDLCTYVNTNPSMAAPYPVGTQITGNTGSNIPFTTCSFGTGGMGTLVLKGTNTLPADAPLTIEIDVPDVSGQNTLYALLNNYWGTVGENEYKVVVNFTDGSFVSFDSIGGVDTRDFWLNPSTSNSIGANTTTWWSNYTSPTAAYARLDVRQFDISAHSSKTVKSVTLTQVHPKDSAMLSGLTFTTNPIGILPDLDPGDRTGPVLVSSNPADDSDDVAIDANIELTFDEPVVAGTGYFYLYDADGEFIEGFGFESQAFYSNRPIISADGLTVTLNPSQDLDYSAGYYIRTSAPGSPASPLKDGSDNEFAGISDAATLNFVTGPEPIFTNWADWVAETSFPFTNTSNTTYRYRDGGSGTVLDPNTGQQVGFVMTGEVTGTRNGVAVTLYSDNNSVNWYNTENPQAAYEGSLISSPQGSDKIVQTGYTAAQYRAHEIVFDTEVTGLVMGIWSLGGAEPSSMLLERKFDIIDTDSLTMGENASGYVLSGDGAAGIIQFCGPIKSLKWNVTDPEFYSAFNFAITTLPAACADGPAKAVPGFDIAGPVISGPSGEPGDGTSSVSIWENTVAVTTMSATDDNSFTWSIAADDEGYDNGLFEIDENGNLTFKVAPDFEADRSNVYVVQVVATDAYGNVSTQDVTVTVGDVDEVPPVIEQTDGDSEPSSGATAALSMPEGQSFVTTYSANEAVTWSLSGGDDADVFEISVTGVLSFKSSFVPDFEQPIDVGDGAENNTYVVEVTATDDTGNTSVQTLTVTITDIWDSLPGTVPSYSEDKDGDGVADSLESTTADRDGDGIKDAEDYDPQGYFYCEDDGRILAGGRISVSGPAGSNSTVGLLNNIRIVKDGSDGEYQWFATAPGTYSMSITYPTSVGIPSTTRTSSGVLDVTTLLPENPASIGSSEFGATGFLSNFWDGGSDPSVAANTTTAFYTEFVIEAGDPHILGNNIPVAQCGVNKVSIAKASDGAEANGDTTSPVLYTLSQARVSTKDTVVTLDIDGSSTATEEADFGLLSRTATIKAGQTSTQISLSVVEDGLIEGDEAVVVAVTGVAGDLTTQVTDVAAAQKASALIIDDDFTDVVINEIDLTTTEGREADPATLGLSLAGQPNAPVVMSITVDEQCTVTPNTMTFTADNFAVEQLLTIQAVNDDLVEGTHSCQPVVSISSTDVRYNEFAVTLPVITVADDLVDQIRTALGDVLQRDFERTVAAQSQEVSRISKGALGRLHEGKDELDCADEKPFGVNADTKASSATGIASAGTFGKDTYNCQTGVRTLMDGSFTYSESKTSDAQGLFSVTVLKEKQEGSSKLSGFFLGGYGSRTDMGGSGTGSGSIDGVGLKAGIYGARAMGDGLFFDYYAAGGIGSHRFDLSFFAPAAPITATGDYDYRALYAGVAVSGETVRENVTIRPRVGLDLSYAAAGDADVSASQLGLTDTGRIGLERIRGATGYAEAVFSFGRDSSDQAEDAARPVRKIEFAPRALCARQVGSDTNACGGGAALSFTNSNPLTGNDLAVTLEFEGTKHAQRSSLGLSYTKTFLDGAGSVVSTMGTDAQGNATIEQTIGIKF